MQNYLIKLKIILWHLYLVASFVIEYNCFKTDPISIEEYIVIHHNNTSKVNTMDNLVK